MSDRGLSEAAMLAGLRDIHLPETAAGGMLADLAAAAGLGGLAALACAALIRLLSQRAPRKAPQNRAGELARLSALPPADQRVALLHMLRDVAPERYAALQATLYRRDGGASTEAIRAEVARYV